MSASAPTAASSSPAAGGWGPGSSPDAGTTTGKTTAVVSPTGAATSGGWGGYPEISGSLKPGISHASVIGTNDQVFTWTGDSDPKPTASAAPTYSGWGDWHGGSGTNGTGSGVNGTGPAAGSDASNVTKPFEPLAETGCNSASDRSKWCGKYSIDTDYYPPRGRSWCLRSWRRSVYFPLTTPPLFSLFILPLLLGSF